MRKNESISEYEARARAEAEQPAQVQRMRLKVAHMACEVRAMIAEQKAPTHQNAGGEASGKLEQ